MAKVQFDMANNKYEEVWRQLLSMVAQNQELKANEFYNSVSVNRTGFKDWMSSRGYGHSFREIISSARKILMEPTQIIDEEQEISDDMDLLAHTVNKVTNDSNEYLAEATQYWWLNVDPKTWDIEKANIDDEKTISFFDDKKSNKNGFKGIFLKWLYCYFIDREDNPHFSHPININEPGISYLDYAGQKIDRKSVESARNMVRKAETLLLGNIGIVTNPTSVLGSKSYIKDGNRSDRSWVTPESNYSYKGKQRRRVLNAASRGKVDYFYRNRPDEIPKNAKERLLAPEIDPELGFPSIRDISPFELAKEGDIVFACSTSRKHIFEST